MSTHQVELQSRLAYVASAAQTFFEIMLHELSLEEIEAFAQGAEAVAHEKSREMTEMLKGDLEGLTSHANCMRTLSAKIVLLREGLVPALKIDRDDQDLWRQAVMAMAWIRSDFEAMEIGLR